MHQLCPNTRKFMRSGVESEYGCRCETKIKWSQDNRKPDIETSTIWTINKWVSWSNRCFPIGKRVKYRIKNWQIVLNLAVRWNNAEMHAAYTNGIYVWLDLPRLTIYRTREPNCKYPSPSIYSSLDKTHASVEQLTELVSSLLLSLLNRIPNPMEPSLPSIPRSIHPNQANRRTQGHDCPPNPSSKVTRTRI